MRTISKYISFTLMVFAVVACHTNDIDNPDNPDNPNPPQISDNVTFTASIKQTRVEYTPNGDKLDQRWKKDDVIYGFYDDGDGDGRKIALLVTDVDDKDGYATLKPLPLIGGDEFVAALKECKNGEQLSFGLIYTGKTGSTDTTVEELYYNDEIHVYMSNQSTGQIPACMESTKYKRDESNNGDTIINFEFENRCAILEIKGITGFKESTDLSEDGPTELDNINVSNVINVITYSYHDGARSLGTDGTYKETGVNVFGSIYVDSNGNIVDSNGNSKSVMMAVAPNEKKEDIIVSAETSGGKTFVSSYNTDLVEGTCYVIRQKDVVAKTEDGLYFTTVKAAFDHAADLSSQGYTTAEDNVVTLIKKEIDGLGENSDSNEDGTYEDLIINIDFPVTLDLNNCDLQLCFDPDNKDGDSYENNNKSGGFYVVAGVNFTITDGSEEGEGYITSHCECPIIDNFGLVTVNYGNLYNYVGNVVENKATGTLTINGGEIYAKTKTAINNTNGIVYIYDGEIDNKGGYLIPVINSSGGTVEISGGYIYNDTSGGQVITIIDGASCTISGGLICGYGPGEPTIGCFSEGEPASSLTIKWLGGTEPTNRPCEEEETLEPFIYAANSSNTSYPVSTYKGQSVNTAQITIMGGYLITSNDRFYCDFNGYSDKPGGNKDPNLKLEDEQGKPCFGGFYSNASEIKFGSYIRDFTDEDSSIRMLGGHDFIAIEDESDKPFGPITNPETEDEIATLYKIIPNVSSSD